MGPAATAPGHEDHHHHDEGDAVMGVFASLLHIFHVLHLFLPDDYLKSRYGPPVSPLQHYGDRIAMLMSMYLPGRRTIRYHYTKPRHNF